jgi:hypothetical protein
MIAIEVSSFAELNTAMQVMKAVDDYCCLHRNMKLDFIKGKPKRAVEHLMSVLKPATLKVLIGRTRNG